MMYSGIDLHSNNNVTVITLKSGDREPTTTLTKVLSGV
jgi:hypothetical protein